MIAVKIDTWYFDANNIPGNYFFIILQYYFNL